MPRYLAKLTNEEIEMKKNGTKDKIAEYRKKYYEEHKEEIKRKKKEKRDAEKAKELEMRQKKREKDIETHDLIISKLKSKKIVKRLTSYLDTELELSEDKCKNTLLNNFRLSVIKKESDIPSLKILLDKEEYSETIKKLLEIIN